MRGRGGKGSDEKEEKKKGSKKQGIRRYLFFFNEKAMTQKT